MTLNEATSKTAGIDQDTVQIGTGITAAATQITRDLSNDLVLSFGNGDKLTISGYFNSALNQPTIDFADGTSWNYTSVVNQVVLVDTSAGGNTLFGLTGVNNRIVGAASDTIYAGNLNDTITAGKGDTVNAGAGTRSGLGVPGHDRTVSRSCRRRAAVAPCCWRAGFEAA